MLASARGRPHGRRAHLRDYFTTSSLHMFLDCVKIRFMTHHLVGVTEIAGLLQVSRQRADQLSRTKGFPDPEVELSGGRNLEA